MIAVTFRIPKILERHFGGKQECHVHHRTVHSLFASIASNHPELYACICEETGRLRQHVNLFINNDLVLEKEPSDIELSDGDVVSIYQAVSGG